MTVVKKELTTDEIKQQNQENAQRSNEILDVIKSDKVFQELDLSNTEESAPEATEQESESKEEEQQNEEQVEEESSEESQEVLEEPEEEEVEEDLIPKSKVQKRIDSLKSEILELSNKLKEMEVKKQVPRDETTEKLDAMSIEELRQVKRQVRAAQLKSQDDEKILNELLDLEEKIDRAVQERPNKVAQAQVEEYNKAANRIIQQAAEDGLEIDAKAGEAIKAIAQRIYDNDDDLKSLKTGQAKALQWAYQHYKELKNVNQTKTNVSKLKGQVNVLKKKTNLDTKVIRGNSDQLRLNQIRKKAIGGTLNDKLEFFRTSPELDIAGLIPEEYKR